MSSNAKTDRAVYIRFKYEIEAKNVEILRRMYVNEFALRVSVKTKINCKRVMKKKTHKCCESKKETETTTCLCAAGFILIGFFIRNLVKGTLKTGGRKKREKKCIINYTSSDKHTNTGSIANKRKICIAMFLCVCISVPSLALPGTRSRSCVRLLFIQYYFQKGCRCIGQELQEENKKQICERAYNKASFQILSFCAWYRNVMSFIYTNAYAAAAAAANTVRVGEWVRAKCWYFMINPYTPLYVYITCAGRAAEWNERK